MAKIKKCKVKVNKTKGSMSIKLFGPGMTFLHKAGLAGLYMTLKRLGGGKKIGNLGNGSWELKNDEVVIGWKSKPDMFFKKLFQESFKIDKNGLVWFTALGNPMGYHENAAVLHEAFLNTFLTHSTSKKIKNGDGVITVGEDKEQVLLKYRKVVSYSHQKAPYSATKDNALVGWYMPGAAVRHSAFGNKTTAIQESPERTLALRYAPVGAIYFDIKSRIGGIKPEYSIVIPEIDNLEKYENLRKNMLLYGIKKCFASGGYEAGMKVLIERETKEMLENISTGNCRVISYGRVPWDKKKKYIVEILRVKAGSSRELKIFKTCEACFPWRVGATTYSQIPGFVAENLSVGRQWWEGFADFLNNKVTAEGKDKGKEIGKIIFLNLLEKGGLAKMVENKETMNNGIESTFIEACHEAWRRRMGQISEKANREHGNFNSQVDREREKLRVLFSRCKNAASLRNAVVDFWSREGSSEQLQANWKEMIKMFDEKNWKKSKDLALLALASYKKKFRQGIK